MKISFSDIAGSPYDKLTSNRFKEGAEFTTFRAYSVQKDKFYSESIGKEFYVNFAEHVIGKAILIKREYKWNNDLTLEEKQGYS